VARTVAVMEIVTFRLILVLVMLASKISIAVELLFPPLMSLHATTMELIVAEMDNVLLVSAVVLLATAVLTVAFTIPQIRQIAPLCKMLSQVLSIALPV